MENEIALVATGYVVARIAVLLAFGYLFYRILRPSSHRVRARSSRENPGLRPGTPRFDR